MLHHGIQTYEDLLCIECELDDDTFISHMNDINHSASEYYDEFEASIDDILIRYPNLFMTHTSPYDSYEGADPHKHILSKNGSTIIIVRENENSDNALVVDGNHRVNTLFQSVGINIKLNVIELYAPLPESILTQKLLNT